MRRMFVAAVTHCSVCVRTPGLYNGVSPTTQRAAIVAATELAAYDECKQVGSASRPPHRVNFIMVCAGTHSEAGFSGIARVDAFVGVYYGWIPRNRYFVAC